MPGRKVLTNKVPSDSLTPLPSTIPPGSIVDTYLRDSGGEGQDRSVSRQLEAIKEYCVRHGLKLRHIYKDAAKSGGSTAGRDDFDRMIASTRDEANRPVAILLWNYARFARDLDDSTYYKALLRSKRGIIIHSLTDHIPEGPYGRFVEILIDISNEEKRRQTSIDAKDGLRSLVAQGAVPGTPPRGFKREPIITINPRTGKERKNHRWVPDPKYVNRIRKAFQMRAAGASLNEIQNACKLYGTINSYATFWTNRLYYGALEYGGVLIENYCEPVVEKSLWDKVQLIQQGFAQRQNIKSGGKDHPRRQASDYILSGLARCARCGSPLYSHTSHRRSYTYHAYLCTLAYRKRGSCSKGRIPKDIFEDAVISTLTEEILQKDNLADLYRILAVQEATFASERHEKRRETLMLIASNKKQRNNIADAIAENGLSPTLSERLKVLEQEKAALDLSLIEHESTSHEEIKQITPEQIKRRIAQIEAILKGKDAAQKKTVLRSFISHIEVEREGDILKGAIYYYIPFDDDIIDDTDDENPPPDKSPSGGNDYVPSPHSPVGAPFRRHIIQKNFVASTKRPRS